MLVLPFLLSSALPFVIVRFASIAFFWIIRPDDVAVYRIGVHIVAVYCHVCVR